MVTGQPAATCTRVGFSRRYPAYHEDSENRKATDALICRQSPSGGMGTARCIFALEGRPILIEEITMRIVSTSAAMLAIAASLAGAPTFAQSVPPTTAALSGVDMKDLGGAHRFSIKFLF